MANNPFFSDAVVISSLSQVCSALNSGFLQIFSGPQPTDANQALTGTLLVSLPLSSAAFSTPTASGGAGSRVVTATAGTIASTAAAASGTAGYFALLKSDGLTVVAMGSVGTSGADLNFNSLSITINNLVSCSAFSLTTSE